MKSHGGETMDKKRNLPTIADLTKEKSIAKKNDEFNYLLNQPPPEKWIKTHPYISGYKYLPIDKIEYLLKRIFKRYRIEITDQGQSFNGVYVCVRLHYLHPVTDEWEYHDGIGAIELQTEKGASPADMSKIKHGAIDKALPAAKSRAVKNACFGFGKFFGSDLNREDTMDYKPDPNLEETEFPEGEDWENLKQAVSEGKMSVAKAMENWSLNKDQYNELKEIENEG